jgi:hypothetical protein
LPEWTKEEADRYENLSDMYGQVVGQFSRYMGHVTKNIGGVQETFKSIEQAGDVYEPTPKATQKEAVAFLNKQLFQTPEWLLDKTILNKITSPTSLERVQSLQTSVLNNVLDAQRLFRLVAANNRFGPSHYRVDELMEDVRKGVWSELASGQAIDSYRRNLQKAHVEKLIDLITPGNSSTTILQIGGGGRGGFTLPVNTRNTDVNSAARGELKTILRDVTAAAGNTSDKMSKYHLQDVADRIKSALEPK